MLEQYLKLKSAIGVSIQINPDTTYEIQACKISVAQNLLSFDKKVTDLKFLEELAAHFPVNSLISLNLVGRGVLHKQMEKLERITPANFSQILPNANLQDFYVQNFISGKSSFISVVRKAEADKWIEQLSNIRLIPLMLSLGPYPVQLVLPQLNIYNEEVIFDGHSILRNEEGDWESYRYLIGQTAPFLFKVENEPLDEKLLIPYAAAFQLLSAHYATTIQAEVQTLGEQFQRIISIKKNKLLSAVAVGFFAVLLIVNFMVLSHLEHSNAQMDAVWRNSTEGLREYADLERAVRSKEMQLKSLGWDGGISKAKLIDQLAQNLPEGIMWEDIRVNPVNPEREIDGKLSFSDSLIRVSGYSSTIVPVDQWISEIRQRKWVSSVVLKNYVYNPEDHKGKFVLIIRF